MCERWGKMCERWDFSDEREKKGREAVRGE